ncbi:hypothetical protein PC115_g7979 [Phytophthora cactorum]|uniref:Uncharacterized protein n=2 Tax=Phytophthora cactorum TaxID=29920 RepID=A0A8T1CSS5_9STRA|nr:hypothetical protein PC115_g7979 [Phytophthora cactorum]
MDLELPTGTKITVGDDYNCTLDPITDRSYAAASTPHDSPALRRLLDVCALVDPVVLSRPVQMDSAQLRRHIFESHTYHYHVEGHGDASSRIDRWYISPELVDRVAQWELHHSALRADHRGVKLHLRPTAKPVRLRRPKRVFSAPDYAKDDITSMTKRILEELWAKLSNTTASAHDTILWWDALKTAIVKATLTTTRTKRKQLRAGLKQELRRLRRRQRWIEDTNRILGRWEARYTFLKG